MAYFKKIIVAYVVLWGGIAGAQERISDYSWEGFLAQGEEHYQAQRYENAFYYFEKAIRWLRSAEDLKKPQAARLFFLAGEALRQQGREFDAVPFYERSLYLNREQSPIYLFLGGYYATRRQYAKGSYYYREYHKRNPEDRRAALAFALCLADEGKRNEALGVLQKLPVRTQRVCNYEDRLQQRECLEANLFGNLAAPEPYLAVIRYHELNGNFKEQIEIANALRRLLGTEPRYVYPAVFSYYRANQPKKSIELLEGMIEAGLAQPETYRLLADMLLEIGDREKAEKYRRWANQLLGEQR